MEMEVPHNLTQYFPHSKRKFQLSSHNVRDLNNQYDKGFQKLHIRLDKISLIEIYI